MDAIARKDRSGYLLSAICRAKSNERPAHLLETPVRGATLFVESDCKLMSRQRPASAGSTAVAKGPFLQGSLDQYRPEQAGSISSACSNGIERHWLSMNLRIFVLGISSPISAVVPAIRRSKSQNGWGRTDMSMRLDINSDFVSRTRKNANAAGVGERITAHQCDGSILPLPDDSLDRLTTRNTIIYVDDPAATIGEFQRVLRAGGKLHAIEGDWPMMVIEPVLPERLGRACEAANHACRTPDIGRKLHGIMVRAGFANIDVQVITRPDTDGRLLPMIKNMAEYACSSGKPTTPMSRKSFLSLRRRYRTGATLALAPQFVVTATR